ncbi:5,6-dimethylbenzimidazole synthase [Fulvivirga ulvae]|uniref:5,6-dimethylbenzimidazole synthase n=1 Tax=Fulvivirga ulvae TaxID=2904245 RepID=UPI001F2D3837|nr:5,6-dimethylbenzimidazole synthase [Fulvivirga ulvae]UII33991.1 5,6-dimethylbenzimidazole synthase [Fulvivirga ulvae]
MMDLYDVIFKRRDTRHFTSEPVPDEVLEKALQAGHAAPSVGLSEPSRYYIIEDQPLKQKIKNLFDSSRQQAENQIADPDKLDKHQSLKLEAITSAPVGLVIATDLSVLDEYVIGTIGTSETLTWSTACAIQNIWLSLTEQGYSMGWVSILDYIAFKELLNLPEIVKPLGYFCIGKPADDYDNRPMLETHNWKRKSSAPHVVKITQGL